MKSNPVPPNLPLPSNPSRMSTVAVLLIALFCLLAGGGLVYAWQTSFPVLSVPISPSNPSFPSYPSASVSPQVPADWKTYTNIFYKYQLEYPVSWSLLAPAEGKSETGNLTSIRENFDVYPMHDFAIQSDFSAASLEQMKKSASGWGWEGTPAISESIVGVGNNPIWLIEGLMKWPDNKLYWRKYILILNGNNLTEISWFDDPNQALKQTFDQILSTFKFTDDQSNPEQTWLEKTIDKVSWSTSVRSFKLFYPNDWQLTVNRNNEEPQSVSAVLVKGTNKISIYQGVGGGGYCLYSGDPTFDGNYTIYPEYKEIIKTNGITWRRSTMPEGTPSILDSMIICENLKPGSTIPAKFYDGTSIGSIGITVADKIELNTIDQILKRIEIL